ncbi:MAG: hypothetical protein JO027_17930 [Solirubrobacterales bacterium]|nr:hypothetical protein [Solirubrobacterales bacterium]
MNGTQPFPSPLIVPHVVEPGIWYALGLSDAYSVVPPSRSSTSPSRTVSGALRNASWLQPGVSSTARPVPAHASSADWIRSVSGGLASSWALKVPSVVGSWANTRRQVGGA